MKTAFKKILIGIMCGVMILSGTSCLFTGPSAREEAKYKEQRKQELDKIPIEDSRYKIVSLEEGEELPDGMVRVEVYSSTRGKLTVGEYNYKFNFSNCGAEGGKDDYCFTVSRDDEEGKSVLLNYRGEFKTIGKVRYLYFYEDLIFLNRGGGVLDGRGWYRMQDTMPYILFLYDYNTNTIKYSGYGEDWISSTTDVIDYLEKEQTIKHREENENK